MKKKHREETICLQPEKHYEDPEKEEGKHYLPNSVSKNLKP